MDQTGQTGFVAGAATATGAPAGTAAGAPAAQVGAPPAQLAAPVGHVAAPPAQAAPAQPHTPSPVPYNVFQETNASLRQAQTELASLQQQLAGHGPSVVASLQQQIAAQQQLAGVQVGLARAGVQTDAGMDYLAGRYANLPAEGRPDLASWISQVQQSEPGFFAPAQMVAAAPVAPGAIAPGVAGVAPPTQSPAALQIAATPPQQLPAQQPAALPQVPAQLQSPDATTGSITPTGAVHQPLSEATLANMGVAEYTARQAEIQAWFHSK